MIRWLLMQLNTKWNVDLDCFLDRMVLWCLKGRPPLWWDGGWGSRQRWACWRPQIGRCWRGSPQWTAPYLEQRDVTTEELKGQGHEIFCFKFFSWITFSEAPENNIRVISNFFENSRRYSQVKVHHRCRWYRRQIFHRYQRHQRQILPPVPLVLLTPVANLLPVSTMLAANLPPVSMTPVSTPVANNGDNIKLQTP